MVETSRGSFENHCRDASLIIMNDLQQILSCQFQRGCVGVCEHMGFFVQICASKHGSAYRDAFLSMYIFLYLCCFSVARLIEMDLLLNYVKSVCLIKILKMIHLTYEHCSFY